jgi:hypothetical protein
MACRQPCSPGAAVGGGGDATVEMAHRQPDGTWLWLIDQPSVLE